MPNDAPVVCKHFFGSSEQVTMRKMKKCLHKKTKHIVTSFSLCTPNKLVTWKKKDKDISTENNTYLKSPLRWNSSE